MNKNKKKQQQPRTEPVFQSEHKPHSKEYAIDLAKHMLSYCSDFTHVKKITGLSIKKMLLLGLIEHYYPFTKRVPKGDNTLTPFATLATIEVPDTSVVGLRRKINSISPSIKTTNGGGGG